MPLMAYIIKEDEGWMDYLSGDSFCIANNSDDDRSKRKSNGDDNLKGSSAEHTTPKSENNSIETYSTTKDATDSDPANNSKREDHLALVVNVDDAQNDLDVEMSSPGQKPASGDGEEQANGENDVSDSKTESNSKSSSTEEGQSKAERMKDADNASNKGDESESSDKGKLESKSTAAGDKKQEDDKSNAPSSSKAKRLVVTLPKQLPFCLKKVLIQVLNEAIQS